MTAVFSILRRAFASFLALSLVAGTGNLSAYAATVPPIVLPPAQVTILPEAACVPCVITDGIVAVISAVTLLLWEGSPGIAGMPVYNGANLAPSVWGIGWISDMDHYATIDAGGSVTVVGGSGARLKFTKTGVSGGVPVYRAPLGTFLTLTATVDAGGAVIALTEKDSDGTALRFATPTPTNVGGEPLVPGAVTAFRLTRLTDRNGNTVDYKRDSQGRLTKVEDVHGRYFTMTYNPAGQVATLADSGARSVSFAYDAQGHKVSETGPEGTTGYAYDANHRLTQITYPNNGVRNYVYDAQGRLSSQDDGAGVNAVTFTRSASSTTVTDALNQQTTYEYTKVRGFSVITKVIDATGNFVTFAYDSNQNLTSVTDELGRTTIFAYDSQGNPISVTDTAGNIGRITYEPAFNQPASMTNPLGRKATLNYNSKGDLIKLQDPVQNTITFTQDAFGHTTSVTNALGETTHISYDENGAPASATDPLDQTASMERDALSRMRAFTDSRGNRTVFTYDATGSLTQLKDALNGTTSIAYVAGRVGRLPATITDAKGHPTTLEYDTHGRAISVTNALNQTTSIVYNDVSAPISAQTRNGHTVSIAYDDLHRVSALTLPEGGVSMAYSAVGSLASVTHYNGTSLALTYDALNRPAQVVQTLPNGFTYTVIYAYDANGNRTRMTTPQGTFKYAYDAMDRVTSVTNPYGQVAAFTYDKLGRRKSLIYPNGTTTNYAYDAAGRVTQVTHKHSSNQSVVSSEAYEYDANGNATSVTDTTGEHVYTYDALNRLTAATHPTGTMLPVMNETFAYDAVGNRTQDAERSGYTYDAANRLVSDSSFTYTYDANGNLTSRTLQTTGTTTAYIYNSSDQLIAVQASTYTIATYKYDALGNRVEKNVGGVVTRYVYDGPNVLAILDGNNNVQQFITQGPGIDAPMMTRIDGADYFFHGNALGSVNALTNSSGQTVETVEYQAFGKGIVKDTGGQLHAASTVGNPFLFAARELDHEIGLYFNRARYLDAEVGRFLREDPLPSINQYPYARNNPIRFRDPFGADAFESAVYMAADVSAGFGHGFSLGFYEPSGFYDSDSYGFKIGKYSAGLVFSVLVGSLLAAMISAGFAGVGAGIATGGAGLSLMTARCGPIAVIGRFSPIGPDYRSLGRALNAPYFSLPVPSWLYNAIGKNNFFNLFNKPWLAYQAARGRDFVLSHPPDIKNLVGPDGKLTTFGREVMYLIGKGFHFNADKTRLINPASR